MLCKKYVGIFTIYHWYQSHLPSSKGSLVTSIKSKATDKYHKTDMFYFILYRRSAVTDVTHLLKTHYSTQFQKSDANVVPLSNSLCTPCSCYWLSGALKHGIGWRFLII